MSTRKFFAGIVALVAVFAVASTVSAQTAAYTFTSDLTIGSTGADVVALQSFLESKGHLVIPAGTTKGYFGSLTQSALAKFQAANGISPAAGYFGPVTRAAVNSMNTGGTGVANPCPAGFVSGTFNGVKVCLMGTGTTTPGNDNGPLSGGEASLEDFDVKSGDDTDLEEGMEGAEVVEVEFDVEDGDVNVERVDFHFEEASTSGTPDDEPWEVFENAVLWADGEEVADIDASDEDNWSDEGDDVYRLRFTGIDYTVRDGDKATLVLALDVASNVDDVANAAWDVFVPDTGIRAVDGEGIDQETGDEDDVVSLDFEEAGEGDELTVTESDDNPDGGTLKVDDDSTSDWHTVLVFDLEAGDESDIEVTEIPLTLTFTGDESFNDVINDIELVIDGETYDDYSVGSTTGATTSVTFDLDGEDVMIDADDMVTAELRVKFNKMTGNYAAGDSITADITSANADAIEAEGADDLDSDQISGSVDGEEFFLRTAGVTIADVSGSAELEVNSDATTTDDRGIFTYTFDVTAFEETAYVELSAASGTAMGTDGVSYLIEDTSNVAAAGGSATASLERVSGGSVTGNFVKINEGQTARFKLTVYYNPVTTGTYRVQLYSVNFDVDATDAATQQIVSPLENYESPSKNVQN